MRDARRSVYLALLTTLLMSSAFSIQGSQVLASDGDLESGVQLIVMIEGQVTLGAGIIFGWDKDRLYVATANHVVRNGPQEAQDLRIRLKTSPDKPLKATLLKHADRELDLAVLSVEGPENQGMDPCTLQIDRLVETAAKRGDAVYPVGNPNGVPWGMPVTPDRVAQVVGDQLTFQSAFISKGHSGGGLLNERGEVVGMIKADQPPFGSATSMEKILQALQAWGNPVELRMTNSPPPLMRAIEKRDTNEVKRLLGGKCTEVNERFHGFTPLLMAAEKGLGPIVELLVKAGAQLDVKIQNEAFKADTALQLAAQSGHVEVVKILITAQADIEQNDPDNRMTPLELAVWAGHGEVAKLLIQAGAKTDFMRSKDYPRVSSYVQGNSMLHSAAAAGRVDTTKLLIAAGADIDGPNQKGDTPLLMAVSAFIHSVSDSDSDRYRNTNTKEIVKLLVTAGSDVNKKNLVGETPLFFAVDKPNIELIELLLSAGADIIAPLAKLIYEIGFDGRPKRLSERAGGLDTAKLLLKARANVDQILDHTNYPDVWGSQNIVGMTLLTLSVAKGEVEMSKLLLEAGANVNATDGEGWTALRYAATSGYEWLDRSTAEDRQRALLQLLLHAGADTNAKDKRGDPILCTVIRWYPAIERYEIVEILLKAGFERILIGECSGQLDRLMTKEINAINTLINCYHDKEQAGGCTDLVKPDPRPSFR